MNRTKLIESWSFNFKALFYNISRPQRFQKPLRSLSLVIFLFGFAFSKAQNVLEKKLLADTIKTILIDGNQIFSISVSTSKTDEISILSTLDGFYQNQFQIVALIADNELQLRLKRMPFTINVDDKRNANKVVAATLLIEIPEYLTLNIFSDIGSVDLHGNFKAISIELLQGHCEVVGKAKTATINTIDGDIEVITKSARVNANSHHGNVAIDTFSNSESLWKLQSINGNITVAKQE